MKLLLLALFVLLPLSQAKAEKLSDSQRMEVETLIKEYLLNNGELILESVKNHQEALQEKQRAEAEEKAKAFMASLNTNDLPIAGNKDGDITIVEFFDYNCGYCRKALVELQKVLDKDDQVKVIFMDMPILGPQSLEAAKWSMAAHKQGKYFEYHSALLEHNGPKDPKNLEKIAKKIGLDVKKLITDKESKELEQTIISQVESAQAMNIRGTPGFIINGQIYPGYIPSERMIEIIADARKGK